MQWQCKPWLLIKPFHMHTYFQCPSWTLLHLDRLYNMLHDVGDKCTSSTVGLPWEHAFLPAQVEQETATSCLWLFLIHFFCHDLSSPSAVATWWQSLRQKSATLKALRKHLWLQKGTTSRLSSRWRSFFKNKKLQLQTSNTNTDCSFFISLVNVSADLWEGVKK